MRQKKKVLLVGETWVSAATHYKGFDNFSSATFHSGASPLINALADSEFDFVHMPAHVAVEALPFSLEALGDFAAIILSDLGANSLLLHRFQGIDGRARWRRTPVEEALPVDCLPYDDWIEVPEGFSPHIVAPEHPLLGGLSELGGEWPVLLGANEVVAKQSDEVSVLARLPVELGGHPLLVAGSYGAGRSVAWTSDVSPHWLPQSFVDWPGYKVLWGGILRWVTRLR